MPDMVMSRGHHDHLFFVEYPGSQWTRRIWRPDALPELLAGIRVSDHGWSDLQFCLYLQLSTARGRTRRLFRMWTGLHFLAASSV